MTNKPLIFVRTAIVLPALLCALAATPPARADIITLEVSATWTNNRGGLPQVLNCSPICTLRGDIVIDNSISASEEFRSLVSADVTSSGISPPGTLPDFNSTFTSFFSGPVTVNPSINELAPEANTGLTLNNAAATGGSLTLYLNNTPKAGSVVDYTGGELGLVTMAFTGGSVVSTTNVGALTPVAAAPEPASLSLFGLGVAGLWFARRQRPGGPRTAELTYAFGRHENARLPRGRFHV